MSYPLSTAGHWPPYLVTAGLGQKGPLPSPVWVYREAITAGQRGISAVPGEELNGPLDLLLPTITISWASSRQPQTVFAE